MPERVAVSAGGFASANRKYCIVSFPAILGQDSWNNAVEGGHNFACVWTGKNTSPQKEWYEPWMANVKKAVDQGMTLIVIGMTLKEGMVVKGQFEHIQGKHGPKPYRLGKSQITEAKHLNEMGYKYKVFSYPIGDAPPAPPELRLKYHSMVGGNNNMFDQFSSDGPIDMTEHGRTFGSSA